MPDWLIIRGKFVLVSWGLLLKAEACSLSLRRQRQPQQANELVNAATAYTDLITNAPHMAWLSYSSGFDHCGAYLSACSC